MQQSIEQHVRVQLLRGRSPGNGPDNKHGSSSVGASRLAWHKPRNGARLGFEFFLCLGLLLYWMRLEITTDGSSTSGRREASSRAAPGSRPPQFTAMLDQIPLGSGRATGTSMLGIPTSLCVSSATDVRRTPSVKQRPNLNSYRPSVESMSRECRIALCRIRVGLVSKHCYTCRGVRWGALPCHRGGTCHRGETDTLAKRGLKA